MCREIIKIKILLLLRVIARNGNLNKQPLQTLRSKIVVNYQSGAICRQLVSKIHSNNQWNIMKMPLQGLENII